MRARPRGFDAIVERIREEIVGGRRRPGDRLPPEQVLAQQFNLSRPGVREALRVLEHQGLVQVRHGYAGGVFVAEQGLTPVLGALHTSLLMGQLEVDELYEARMLVEPAIVRLAVERADDALIERLEENAARASNLLTAGSDAFGANLEFHAIIAEGSANRVMSLVMRALVELLESFDEKYPTHPGVSRKAVADHMELIQAIRRRDAAAAETLMARHLLDLEGRFARMHQRLLRARASRADAIPPWGGLRLDGAGTSKVS